jgi:FHA domain-containing protein/von Willebrand factor type A domain-containing protein
MARQLTVVALAGLATVLGSSPTPAADTPNTVVALVLDSSGSIRKDLDRTRDLAEGIRTALDPSSEVVLFSFDDQSRLLLPRTDQRERIAHALASLAVAGRHTALYDALYDASRYLRETGATRAAIILVTDGRDEDSALNLDDGLKLAVDGHIPVFAIGVGEVETRVLRRIAKLTGGAYLPIALARPSDIAGRIRALEPMVPGGTEDGPPVARSSTAARAAPPGPPAPAGSAAATRATANSRPGAVRSGAAMAVNWRPWMYAGLAVALVATSGLWLRRRRAGPRCATCGRPLPNGLSACAFCSRTSTAGPESGNRHATPTVESAFSPTVLARMNNTEEFLEKTITLKERPVLSVTRGPGSGQVYELSRETATSLGRAKANDIVLDDVAVSSQHCRIRPENGHFMLHDLRSTNGTFVNERRVQYQSLTEGDVIQIGETYLQYRTEHRREA